MMARLPPQKSRSVTVAFVTLQRVPPLTRILAPGRRAPSRTSTRTRGFSRRVKIAVARPAAPAPTIATSVSYGSWELEVGGWELSTLPAAVLRGGPPPPVLRERLVQLEPPLVHLVRCRESLGSLLSVSLGDDDLVSRSVRRDAHFTLDGFVSLLEEIEHGRIITSPQLAARRESGCWESG